MLGGGLPETTKVVFDDTTMGVAVCNSDVLLQLKDGVGLADSLQQCHTRVRSTDVLMIVFDIAKPESLESVSKIWGSEWKSNGPSGAPFIVVGIGCESRLRPNSKTKCVSMEQGEEVARQIGATFYVECCCSRQSINGVFEAFAAAVTAFFIHYAKSLPKKRQDKALLKSRLSKFAYSYPPDPQQLIPQSTASTPSPMALPSTPPVSPPIPPRTSAPATVISLRSDLATCSSELEKAVQNSGGITGENLHAIIRSVVDATNRITMSQLLKQLPQSSPADTSISTVMQAAFESVKTTVEDIKVTQSEMNCEISSLAASLNQTLQETTDDITLTDKNRVALEKHIANLSESLPKSDSATAQAQQQQIEELQEKVKEIECYQQVLWQEYRVKEQKREALRQFEGDSNLWLFYRTIQIKLEEVLIGAKAVASEMVVASSGTAGKVAGAVGFFGNVMSILDITGVASGVVNAVTLCTQKGLELVDEKRQTNTAKHISALMTVSEMKHCSEQAAILMTKWFAPQLAQLATAADIKSRQTTSDKALFKVKSSVFKAEEYPPARQFAELSVMWVLDALGDFSPDPANPLGLQLANVVFHHKAPTRLEEIKGAVLQKAGVGIVPTKTVGIDWDLAEVFTKSGIMFGTSKYSNPKTCDTSKYGYCTSPDSSSAQQAAQARGLILEASTAAQKGTSASASTSKHVQAMAKTAGEMASTTELLQKQLQHEAFERTRAQQAVEGAAQQTAKMQLQIDLLREELASQKGEIEKLRTALDESRAQNEKDLMEMRKLVQELQSAVRPISQSPPTTTSASNGTPKVPPRVVPSKPQQNSS
ncbi:hypothetical protein Pelo_11544 [Pelomyxa schiedti]|nr:hypothetical protein Pelo_11544 [Pelomyxa schiedti]